VVAGVTDAAPVGIIGAGIVPAATGMARIKNSASGNRTTSGARTAFLKKLDSGMGMLRGTG